MSTAGAARGTGHIDYLLPMQALQAILQSGSCLRGLAMSAGFQKIDDLPQRNATQVKNQWGDLVRTVHKTGSVAVTTHDRVEMVVMDAERYQEMIALVEGAQQRREAALAELTAEFDRHLAQLQSPDTRDRLEAAMDSRGRVPLPKAGPSF